MKRNAHLYLPLSDRGISAFDWRSVADATAGSGDGINRAARRWMLAVSPGCL
jgi:hypothetical protein